MNKTKKMLILHRLSWIAWGIMMFFVWRKRCGYWEWEGAWSAMSMPLVDTCQCAACRKFKGGSK